MSQTITIPIVYTEITVPYETHEINVVIGNGVSSGGGGTGNGDVTGPASSVAGNFASFLDTTGKVIADSGYNYASFIHQGSNTLTQDLNFDGAFNVGFGTSTPIGSLQVYTGADGWLMYANDSDASVGISGQINNVGGTASMNLTTQYTAGSNISLILDTDTGLRYLDAGSEIFNIDRSGNIGFGQSTPISHFDATMADGGFFSFGYGSIQIGAQAAISPNSFAAFQFVNAASDQAIIAGVGQSPTSSAGLYSFFVASGALQVDRILVTEAGAIKFIPSAGAPTVGYVWTATNIDGSGSWQAASGGGGGTWGSITGTITNQTDLVNYIASFALPAFNTTNDGYVQASGNANSLLLGSGSWIAPGTNTYVLTMTAGVPGWAAAAGGGAWGSITGTITDQTDLVTYINSFTLPAADTSHDGYLTSTDWNTFNGKLGNVLTTAGDLIQSSSGTTAARLAAVAVGSVLVSGGVSTVSAWSASPTLTTSLTVPIIYGSTSSGGTLTLFSTSHATKGKILFGASAYDEVNDRIGISQTTPVSKLDVTTNNIITTPTMASGISLNNNQAATSGVPSQYSPSLTFHGRRYTSSTDKTSDFRIYNESVSTALDILRFQYSDNGGAYSTILSLFFNGTLTTPSAFNALNTTLTATTATALQMAGASGINFNGAGTISYNGLTTANATGQISINGNGTIAATTGTLQAELGVGSTFAPASGAVDYTGQIMKSVIAQTSTASGNSYVFNIKPTYTTAKGNVVGINYDPTVTSITGTHYAIKTTSGSTLLTQGVLTAQWIPAFQVDPGAHTGITASTEFPNWVINSVTQQWSTGTLTTQRHAWIKPFTIAFVGASTVTNLYGLYVDAPVAGTNATITNNWAVGVAGNLKVTGTRVNMASLPTSSAGLASGDLYTTAGAVMVA